MTQTAISPKDRTILRDLASRKRDIAADPVNQERRLAWFNLDSGTNGRPMILAETSGLTKQESPVLPEHLQCEGELARELERGFKYEFYNFDVLKDDHVIEPELTINWNITFSDYGVEVIKHRQADGAGHGSWKAEPPIKDLDADFDKLKPRTLQIDREATLQRKALLDEIFGGILPVTIRGGFWWTMGMTIRAIDLIGLEELMMAMFDNPEGLHRLMAFLRDDHLAVARQLEAEGLLSLNNRNDYIGSGSMGYTNRLPQSDWTKNQPVRMKDQWVLLESQETVGVGPNQFAEFIFPYQNDIAKAFGSVYYGCCEPIHTRWHVIEKLANLERVSISPWCDEAFMAEALAQRYVYSRKPNPTLVSTETFDETAIRNDLATTLNTARNCRLEIIMKDVHTLSGQPERLPRWVQLAREQIAKANLPTRVN